MSNMSPRQAGWLAVCVLVLTCSAWPARAQMSFTRTRGTTEDIGNVLESCRRVVDALDKGDMPGVRAVFAKNAGAACDAFLAAAREGKMLEGSQWSSRITEFEGKILDASAKGGFLWRRGGMVPVPGEHVDTVVMQNVVCEFTRAREFVAKNPAMTPSVDHQIKVCEELAGQKAAPK